MAQLLAGGDVDQDAARQLRAVVEPDEAGSWHGSGPSLGGPAHLTGNQPRAEVGPLLAAVGIRHCIPPKHGREPARLRQLCINIYKTQIGFRS